MDDMTTFERQLSGEITGLMGPVRSVDDLAVFDAVIAASRSQGWGSTIFSALKFVVAASIVALFGGFLLMGILTAQPRDDAAPAAVTESPSLMTTDDLLSGMVTEEVEPGVFRIVNDGYRDLAHPEWALPAYSSLLHDAVIVGGARAVWRVAPHRPLLRLGEAEEWSYDPDLLESGQVAAAGPDGRLWTVSSEGRLRVFDSGSWTDEHGIASDVGAVAVGGDGTVWALGDRGLMWTFAGGDWESSDWADVYDGEAIELAATDDGEAWLLGISHLGDAAVPAFLHFDGSAWQVVPSPDGAYPYLTFDVGPDGTVWAGADTSMPSRSLARLDDSGWTVFTAADGVEPWGGHGQQMGGRAPRNLEVAPDGSAWVNAAGCDGVARFDGQTWTPYLAGSCISDFDIAPDGSVWVVARSQDGSSGVDTYVIRPEAVVTVE